MKGIFSIIILILLAAFLLHLDTDRQEREAIFISQDSELALLMREMHEEAKAMKMLIQSNDQNAFLVIDNQFILEATPTKDNVKGDQFEAMARYYLQKSDSLTAFPDKSTYNDMVESCIACHQSFCPGPIKTIKKLTIN
jgi:hypothetical protein